MNSKIFVSIALILSIVTCAILGTVNASAFEQQEINLSAANSTQNYVTMDDTNYLYREVEPNDSIATANIRISQGNQRIDERVLIGTVGPFDKTDYFEIYVEKGKTYKIKLISLTPALNLYLYLQNIDGVTAGISINGTTGSTKHITYTAKESRKLYVKVYYATSNGTEVCRYRLMINETVDSSFLIQSFFPPAIDATYFRTLGEKYPDNASGIVVLTVGYGAKDIANSLNGVIAYDGHFSTLEELKTAIIEFAKGYSNASNHTNNIEIAVSIVNKNVPSDYYDFSLECINGADGLTPTQRLNNHGKAYAQMIKEANEAVLNLAAPSRVSRVCAAYDSELNWNTYNNTFAWISGYGSVSLKQNIYVNANCNIDANGAEITTENGWNYLHLKNVCANPGFLAFPLPQSATQKSARNWLDFFNWLEKKHTESFNTLDKLLYAYNMPVGFMNNNIVSARENILSLKQIVKYTAEVYNDTRYDYAYLRAKHGAALPQSWFEKSTWCTSGNYYQLQYN